MSRRELLRHLERWRKRMVPEWRLTVMDSAPDGMDEEEFLATVQADEDYHHAKIYFTATCLARDPASIEITIVHELLHLLTRDVRRTLDLCCPHLTSAVYSVVSAHQTTAEEKMVERVARTIVHAERGEWPAFGILER